MIEKIDTHHHFWHYDPSEYGWIDERMSTLRRDFLPPDLKAATQGSGISGVISVQARQSLEETHALLDFAANDPFFRAVVGWVPLISPDLNRLLPAVAGHPKLRAVRHVLQYGPEADVLAPEEIRREIMRRLQGILEKHA